MRKKRRMGGCMLRGRCGGGMWILSEHERGVLEVVFMGI